MRIHRDAAVIALALTAVLAACGSYSAPNNTNMAPDSSGGDSMPTGPGPGYTVH